MSTMHVHRVSALIGPVPLFAVTKISLTETYELPPVGDLGRAQATGKTTRQVQVEAVLIGRERRALRLALEATALLSKTLPAVSLPLVGSAISGIPFVSGLTTLLDVQISSLTFSQSADEKDTIAVSITLKHCPRPGVMALISEGVNAAGALVGAATPVGNAVPRSA